jgi:signal transduction histidine kinase/ActR/RegA family two-component response regulator
VLAAHRSLQLLRASSQRLADFTTASGDWFWETDAQGRLSWASRGLAQAWGVADEFVPGRPLPDVRVTDERSELSTLPPTLGELLARRERLSRVMICRGEATDIRCLLLFGIPCFDGEEFCGYRGTARDISARAQAEREGRRASRALQRIAAVIPGLIYQFRVYPDGTTQMPYASEHIEAVYELTPEQVRDDASVLHQRIHPDDAPRVRESVLRAAATLSRWRTSYRVRLPRRGERVLFAQAIPERQDDGSVTFYGVVTDVTDEVNEREQLESMRIERDTAARSAAARAELMSRVSHELRTPLNAIIGFAQLLRLRFADSTIEPGRSARHIHHAGEHLLSLINDMLDISSLEAGRVEIRPQPISVKGSIERSIEMVTPQAAHARIKLKVEVSPQVEGVLADERATRQVLINLLANAIKFSPPDSTVRVKAQRAVGGDQIDLLVCDEGPGVSLQRRERLFEPFERLDTEDRYIGNGLGLTISRKLAQLMGGDIQLFDAPCGACFCFTLPAARLPQGEVAATDFQGLDDPSSVSATQRRLLYIEDDPVNALVMEGFIGLVDNVSLQVAPTCAQGLEAALSKPDLIFLDMHLPDGSGFTVIKALKADARTRQIPVIAVSADAMPEQIEAAMRAGFEGYITKPVDYGTLTETLTRQFASSPMALLHGRIAA